MKLYPTKQRTVQQQSHQSKMMQAQISLAHKLISNQGIENDYQFTMIQDLHNNLLYEKNNEKSIIIMAIAKEMMNAYTFNIK